MARNFSSWLEGYCEYTSKQESPSHFHWWSGMSAIASALGRRVYLDRGYYTLFPNQYIVLVAESALCRKSTAARLASDMLEKTGVDIVKEKLTVGYLYRHLSGAAAARKSDDSSIVIFAPELSTFLGKEAHTSGLIATLTSVYDCPSKLEYRTKTAGVDIIHNPCVNMLGATTLDWMSTNMPGESVEGGFTSRVLFVVGEEPRTRIAWPHVTPKEINLKEQLISDIIQISQLKGEMHISPHARDAFEHWYLHMKEPTDLRLKSFFGRKGDHILKVAIALAAAESNELRMEERHVVESIKQVESIEKNMPIAFRGVAFSRSAKDIDRVLGQIEKKGGKILHSELLRMNNCFMNFKEFREVIDTLKESKMISAIHIGVDVAYQLIKRGTIG